MNSKKKISIYVRNKEITPSSYYRIVQYAKYFDGEVSIKNIAPKKIYVKRLNSSKENFINWSILSIIYYITMVSRVTYFLIVDSIKKPEYIIVSKTFCPGYTPLLLRIFIGYVSRKSSLLWDFDDHIMKSKEISKEQAQILSKNSKKIIVTNEFLKSTVDAKFRHKVILLPTTDGDLQGFDEKYLREKRKSTFSNKIKLVWVATGGNLPNLIKIISTLDKAAKILKQNTGKQLELIVVCNKPVDYKVENLIIRNVKWTREVAKEEIYNAHIGIMPLIYREYSLGKGGFKLVQYISTGLPIIASNVGFNKEVVANDSGILVNDRGSNEEWIEAIMNLSNSFEKWERVSVNAYKRWNESFSYKRNLKVWNDILND